jgi:Zn-dependent protease
MPFENSLISILFGNPFVFLVIVLSLIISLSIHEFAHAYVADRLGDNTAKILGRVTLDPRAHLDPIGLLMLLFAGFGWGRPVPFNPINLKNPKRDSALIALAGPVSNFILAAVLTLFVKVFSTFSPIVMILLPLIYYNLILGVFNLIPVHPLDGFKVVAGMLPPHLYIQWMQMQSYGVLILILLILTNSLNVVIRPVLNLLTYVLGL